MEFLDLLIESSNIYILVCTNVKVYLIHNAVHLHDECNWNACDLMHGFCMHMLCSIEREGIGDGGVDVDESVAWVILIIILFCSTKLAS